MIEGDHGEQHDEIDAHYERLSEESERHDALIQRAETLKKLLAEETAVAKLFEYAQELAQLYLKLDQAGVKYIG